ncbi:MAG: FlgD immunoglobulin-like domain containing protein [Candidatus Krumholzibacteriota bacterium]
MKKHLFGMALIACLVMISGAASAQTIDEIQFYNAGTGLPEPGNPNGGGTDLLGAIVTVTGTVVELHQFSSGSAHVVDATGQGIAIYHGSNPFATTLGQEIEVTGTVGTYRDQIQLTGTVTLVETGGTPVVPVTDYSINFVKSTYENVGKMGRVIGTVTSVVGNEFFVSDAIGDTIKVYIDSTTGIDITAVAVDDLYAITSPITTDLGEIEMKPRFQSDLVENPGGDTLPVITAVDSDNWTPEAADPVTISANIVDDIGVTSALLYYRDSDGVTPGAWGSVAMSNVGDVYSGVIPGGHSSTQIDYYIEATDTGAQTVTLPGAAPTSFLTVAVGFTPIWDVQYAHPDSSSQSAAMNGQFVNIQGVVTAGTSHVGSPTKFIVQEPEVNPATEDFKFSGILVYETTAAFEYYQGDMVAIGGEVDEYFGLTEMIPHNGNAVYLLGFGNDLPAPARVDTRTLSDDEGIAVDGNGNMGEAWESVWVQTWPAAVEDTLGFGEYIITDTGARADSLVVDPLTQLTYVPTLGDVIKVTSYMDYSYGSRRIVPIADEFIIQTGATPVENLPNVVAAGGLKSIAPNPFNPKTTIKFVVNRENLVQLNIYNIRGQKVKTLVQGSLPANEYSPVWDGTNDAGQTVASGAYFARLRIGAEVVQVKQMTLVK